MFGIGMPELLVILAIALIVIGPKKLPDLAKSLGKALGEFKKATNELKQSIHLDSELSDVRKAFNEAHADAQSTVKDEGPSVKPSASANASSAASESENRTEKPPAESFDNLKTAFDNYNQPAETAAPGSSCDVDSAKQKPDEAPADGANPAQPHAVS
jgi:sec-independent protein translocase protein TatB